MLHAVHPKLPMRDKNRTRSFYIEQLGFRDIGMMDYPDYLMLKKDEVEIHFFSFSDLDPLNNYGQIYIRVSDAKSLYDELVGKTLSIPKLGHLKDQPWMQREFSVLDPDHNLLTFGQNLI